ncbi:MULTISPECIES: response regulator [unclassified Sphingomonas]|uniref:response regulator n=1 Tax=unclassified Sphingomonas TaxID=196159 RepID=UPI00092C269F|nr:MULTISPECIES: response regulator [unclassified Sphingomonas]MBN8849692.1 response regulator [Sphingomonas sp.]MBS0282885.1 response regulator [Pseudomonadota bacterium]OJV31597.1 MAG: transcriptional regulator [Sphingomonas sp. 67-36]
MTKRVLIVEDEPLIAMMLEDFLDALGRSCAGTADCSAEALPLVESGAVDCAILDVNLRGGEKSWVIADALETAGIPFVFATGGTSDTIVERHRDRPQLMKPFTMEGVQRALDRL